MFVRICTLLLLLPTSLFAWGGVGHRVVAGVAEQRLQNSPALAAAIELLEGKHLADVASDPDKWRSETGMAHSGAWHFVNTPLGSTYLKSRDCEYADCIVERIEDFEKTLADKTQSKDVRREALIFLVHFLGDIHQPLHCEQGRLKNGKPDRGGNLIPVTLNGKHLNGKDDKNDNLHFMWDVVLVESGDGQDDKAYVNRLLTEKIKTVNVAEVSGGTPRKWAAISHEIATKVQVPEGTDLTDEYITRNKPRVDQRLLLGGLRLAAIIEGALGSQ
jgi:hypothetical protein